MGKDEDTGDVVAWGRDLERRHAWLLQTATLAVGPVERFYTGAEDDRYVSAVDGAPVVAPVLLLGTGHAMLAQPRNFVEIGPDEANVYISTIERLRETLSGAITNAVATLREKAHEPELPFALVISALRAQLYALEAIASAPSSSPPHPENKS